MNYSKFNLFNINKKELFLHRLGISPSKTFVDRNSKSISFIKLLKNQNTLLAQKSLVMCIRQKKQNSNKIRVMYSYKKANALETINKRLRLCLKDGILKNTKYVNFLQSSLPGTSAKTNASLHKNYQYTMTLDISNYFPSNNRQKIKNFFAKKLQVSQDIANFIADSTTIDNKLAQGSACSDLIAFLCNFECFCEINEYCKARELFFTIYVDDITISSNSRISINVAKDISNILKKHHLNINKEKTKTYNMKNNHHKKVTGIIVNRKGLLTIRNSQKHSLKQKPFLNYCYYITKN